MNNNGNAVFDVSEATFARDVLERSYDVPVVVDFWAPWCGPCRMLGPILERLARAEAGPDFVLAKLNVDDNQSLALYYGVQGIPAVKAFRDGEVVDEFVGALPEPQVQAFLERLAPGAVAAELKQAASLLAAQQWAAAEDVYRQIRETENEEALLGMARALLGQGKGCEALETLADLSDPEAVPALEWLEPLAGYLCRQEEARTAGEALSGAAAAYQQAAANIRAGDFAATLESLLAVLREDKGYDEGRARQAILGIFALLGDESDLTQKYRPQLAAILF